MKHESASSLHGVPNPETGAFIVKRIHEPGRPLSDDEEKQLRALAKMPDSEIDFSDIPEWTEEDRRSAVRGGYRQKSLRNVTLYLQDDTASWLQEYAGKNGPSIHFALKQAAQHGKRAERERVAKSDRAIYDETSKAFAYGLELLARKFTSDARYVEVPELSDDELRRFSQVCWPTLTPRTVTLLLDDEVYSWIQELASSHTIRINYAIAQLAHKIGMSFDKSLHKAS